MWCELMLLEWLNISTMTVYIAQWLDISTDDGTYRSGDGELV